MVDYTKWDHIEVSSCFYKFEFKQIYLVLLEMNLHHMESY